MRNKARIKSHVSTGASESQLLSHTDATSPTLNPKSGSPDTAGCRRLHPAVRRKEKPAVDREEAREPAGKPGATDSPPLREVRNSWLGIIAGFKGSYSRLQKEQRPCKESNATLSKKEDVITDVFRCSKLEVKKRELHLSPTSLPSSQVKGAVLVKKRPV